MRYGSEIATNPEQVHDIPQPSWGVGDVDRHRGGGARRLGQQLEARLRGGLHEGQGSKLQNFFAYNH